MRFAVLLLSMLASITSGAFAQQVQVLAPAQVCSPVTDIQGFRTLRHVAAPKGTCDQALLKTHGFEDRRLGIGWSTVINEFMSWVPFGYTLQADDTDPAASAKLCLHRIGRDVKEWIVPLGHDCVQGRVSRFYRYYVREELVCIMPSNYCVRIDTLTQVGKDRVGTSIALAK